MTEGSRRKARLWLPVLAWACLIFAVSQIPSLRSPLGLRWLRKLAHVVEYAVFSGLLARALRGSGVERGWWAAALFACCLFAASAEWHQHWVHGRHPSFKDVQLDAAGGALGLLLYGAALRSALPEGPDGR